ncbi:MAG: autotransporter-associated beta strand repeat-containing protein [Planctomycetes bacterium]|nr:autotransporter-associated beta strand repeat-containing protein [Planctomycetota bacterium]
MRSISLRAISFTLLCRAVCAAACAVVMLHLGLQPAVAQWQGATSGDSYAPGNTYDYDAPANWVGGTINDSFLGTTLTGNVTLSLDAARTTVPSGLNITYAGAFDFNLFSDSATPRALTLGGNVIANATDGNQTITIGTGLRPVTLNLNDATRTFTVGTGDTLVVNGVISSTTVAAGGLTKAGTGTLTLNAANTFAGPLTITDGTVKANTSAAALGAGVLALGGGTLDFNHSALLNFGRATAVYGNTTIMSEKDVAGTGVTYTLGTMIIGANTLNVQGGNVTSGTAGLTFGVTSLNGNATINITDPVGGGTTLLTVGAITGFANSITLQGNGDFAQAGVWSGAGSSLVLDTGYSGLATLNQANTFTGGVTINSTSGGTLRLNHATAANTPISFGTGSTGVLQVQLSTTVAGLSSAATGAIVENGVGGATTLTVSNPKANTFAGVIQNGGAGTLALTLSNSGNGGVLTLTGSNNYSGLTTISANAVLNIQNNTALGNTTAGTSVTNLGALQVQNNITVGNEALTLNGTGVTNTGALRNIADSNTYGGLITLGSASRINSDSGTLTLDVSSGNAISSGANQNLTIGGAGSVIVADPIATLAGTLTKDGTGTLTLRGLNTYTGLNTVQNGKIKADASNNLVFNSANALTFNGGGTFEYDNGTAAAARAQSLGALTFQAGDGTVQLTQTAAQNLKLTHSSLAARAAGATGNFVWNGVSDANNGIYLTGVAAGFINQGEFFNGSNYAYMNALGTYVRGINYGSDASTAAVGPATEIGAADASKHIRIDGTISGQNTRTILTLNLAGAYDFTLAGSQTLTLTNGGILKAGGGSSTISGGTALTHGTLNGEYVVRTDAASDSLTINTPINANGANIFTKSGAGTLTLGASNAFTGNVFVNGGTLSISNNNNLGPVATTKAITLHGATLQLTNNIDFYNGAPATNPKAFGIGPAGATIDTGVNTATISGVISSSVANLGLLTKSGSGTLVLSGANTLTGGLSLNQGDLVATVAGGFGTSGNTLFFNGGNLELRASATAYTGKLDMTAAGTTVTINPATLGSGVTHSLSTAATLGTQTMVIQKGSLTNVDTNYGLTLSAAPILTGNPTFTINGNGTGVGTLTLAGGLDMGGATRTLTFNSGTGSSAVVINAGALTGTPGTLELAGTTPTITVNALTTTANNLKLSGSGTYTLQGASTYTGNTILNNSAATVIATNGGGFGTGNRVVFNTAGAGFELKLDAGTTFTTGLDSSTNGGTITVNRATPAATATTHILNQANFLGGNTINVQAGANITSGTAYGLTLSGANVLTGSPTFSINGNGAGVGTLTLSGGFDTQGTTRTLTFNGGTSAAVISGAFAGAAGILDLAGSTPNVTVGALTTSANAVQVSGSGIYTFNGASTFTGGVILNNSAASVIGTVGGGFGATAGKVKFNVAGTAFELQNNTGTTFTSGIDTTAFGGGITVNRATPPAATATTHTLSLANSLGGTTLTVSPGANISSGTAYGLTLSGTSTLSGAPTFVINNNGAGIGTLTLGAVLNYANNATITGAGNFAQSGVWGSGSGGITLDGSYSGAATLNQANTFTGGVSLSSGTLNINSVGVVATNGPLGNGGTFSINGGTIDNTSASAKVLLNVNPITLGGNFAFSTSAGTANNNLTLPGAVSMGADRTITLNGAGALNLSGLWTNTNDSVRTLTINNGAGTTAATLLSIGSYNLTGPGSTAARNNIINGTGNVTISGVVGNGVSAGSALTYNGTGTLSLGGSNTFTGGLTVMSGTVSGTVANAFGGSGTGAVTLGDATTPATGATLNLGVAATFANPITTVPNANSGVLTIQDGGNFAAILSGPITQNSALTIRNTGTTVMTLTGGISTTSGTANLTLNAAGTGGITLSSNPINNAGSITNASTSSGPVIISAAIGSSVTNILQSGSSNLSITSATIANNGNLTFSGTGASTVTVGTGAINTVGSILNNGITTGTTILSGTIGNTISSITQNSPTSTLALSGNNSTYTNGLLIYNGTASATGVTNPFGAAANVITLGDSTTAATGATLNLGIAGTFANPITTVPNSNGGVLTIQDGGNFIGTLSGPITQNSALTIKNNGTQLMTISGGISTTSGTANLTLNATGTGGITLSTNPINNAGTITNAGTAAGVATISSVIGANVTGVNQNSAPSTLTLSGPNTYTSATTVSAGTLIASNASALGTTAAGTSISSGATLDVRANIGTEAITSLEGVGVGGNGALITGSGSGTVGGAVTLVGTANIGGAGALTIGGAIGDGGSGFGITKVGAGVTTLTGANTYIGPTTINAGSLIVNGSLAAGSAVSINGGTLGGSGNVAGTVAVNSGGTISPGNSPGTLNTGATTYASGGTYKWEINNALTTQGIDPGWDYQNINGTLDITATSGAFPANTFRIDVTGLDPSNVAGAVSNWNPHSNYTWNLATASSGITNFAANKFDVLTTNFSNFNALAGTFGVATSGNNLQLTYTAGAGAATSYWDLNSTLPGAGGSSPGGVWGGSNANWSFSSLGTGSTYNWTNGDNAVFAAGTDGNGSYIVTIAGGGVTAQNITFEEGQAAVPITTISGGTLTLAGTTPTISVAATRTAAINSVIAGTDGLVKGTGTGTLTLSGLNTYTGVTNLNASAGITQVSKLANGLSPSSIGQSSNVAANLLIGSASTLQYIGSGDSTNRSFTLNGTTNAQSFTLDASGSGALSFTNTGSLAYGTTNQTRTLVLSGSSTAANTFSPKIEDNGTGATSVTKSGVGTWVLNNDTSNYTGTTAIQGGTLSITSIKSVGGGASAVGAPAPGNGTISIGSTTTTGQLTYTGTGDTTDRVINQAGTSGGVILDQSGAGLLKFTSNLTATGAGTKNLTLQGSTAGTGEIAGAIGQNGTTTLTKAGTGTWTLSGSNTFSGSTTITGGTLNLDYNTNDTSKLADGSVLLLSGGTLNFMGAAGTHHEIVVSTTLTGANNVTRTSGAAVLRMGGITASAGSVNFGADNIASTTNTNANGILQGSNSVGWATVGGTDWAANSGTLEGSGNNFIVAYSGYADVTRQISGPQSIIDDSTSNVRIIEGSGGAADITLGAATTTLNTLNQSSLGGTGAATIDPAGQTLGVRGVLIGSDAGSLTIGNGVNNGTLRAAVASGNLLLNNQSTTSVLTVNSVIANNTGTSTLTKVGLGTATLAATNSYNGTTTVNGGTLNANATGAIPGALTVSSGTLNANASGAISGATTVSGGTLVYGAIDPIADGQNVTVSSGTLNIGAFSDTVNTITLSGGTITGTTGVLTSTSTIQAQSGTVSAVLGGDVGMNKTTGTVTLSGLNTFTGDIVMPTSSGGTLIVNTLSNKGVPSSIGAGGLDADGAGPGTILLGDIFMNTPSGGGQGTLIYTGGSVTTDRGLYFHQNTDRVTAPAGGTIANVQISNSGVTVGFLGNSKWGSGSGQGKTFFGPTTGLSTLNFGAVELFFSSGDGGQYTATPTLNVNIASLSSVSGGTTASNFIFNGPTNSIGNINFTLLGKSLSLSGTGITTLTGNNSFSGAGTMLVDNGIVILTGSNSGGTMTWSVANDAILRVGNGGTTGTISGLVSNAGQLIFNRSDSTYVSNNNISGAGRVQQLGSGRTTLSGTNTNTGQTIVTNGTLQFQKEVSLYNNTPASWTAANIVVEPNATLAFNVGGTGVNAGQFTASDLDALKAIGTSAGGFKSGTYLGIDTSNAVGTFVYNSNISNPNGGTNVLGLTKLGGSALDLGGTNTYTGTTNVRAGTLRVNGTHTGGGLYTIDANGTLGGAGSTTSDVLVYGTLAPGNSIESLGTGSMTFDGAFFNGTYDYELDTDAPLATAADLLYGDSGSTLTLNNALLLLTDLGSGSTLTSGTKLTMIAYDGIWNGGEFFEIGAVGSLLSDDSTFSFAGNNWLINYDDASPGSNFLGDITTQSKFVTITVSNEVAAVPEPATWALAVLGLLGLVIYACRRCKQVGTV